MASKLPVQPGDTLDGKYRVEKILGVGGMGAVVAARHVDLGTRVALKFLLPELVGDGDAVARFQREGRAAARLKGEHTARVLDVGKLADGTPYLVMELLVGRDLGQVVVEDGPLPVGEAAGFVLQACASIAEAHGLGIVHRDLKPQNLFLTRRVDGAPLVKVLDFGISKQLATGRTPEQKLTAEKLAMGTPAFMAPEQMKDARNVDARADIWSLGVVLYELITGQLPYAGETAAELLANVLTEDPIPLAARRSDAPAGLDAVIQRCLQRDREARWSTIAELALALSPFASGAGGVDVARIASLLAGARATISDIPPKPEQPPLADTTFGAATPRASPAAGPTVQRPWGRGALAAATKRQLAVVAGGGATVLAVAAAIAFAARRSPSPDEPSLAAMATAPAAASATTGPRAASSDWAVVPTATAAGSASASATPTLVKSSKSPSRPPPQQAPPKAQPGRSASMKPATLIP